MVITRLYRASVLLVDTLGVLNDYYRTGKVAFVGGGFDPKHGGHNILEPALLGLPVLYGKHMGNFEEEARLLAESGGGIPIDHPEDLTPALEKLLGRLSRRILRTGAAPLTSPSDRACTQTSFCPGCFFTSGTHPK